MISAMKKGGEYMISKKIVVPLLVAGVISGVSIFGVSLVNAQEINTHPMSGLVTRIAEKFGLDQSQVQTVVDQFHSEQQQTRLQDMQKREEERLSQLVNDGKITQAQKKAIIEKQKEMRTKYNPETMKSMTMEERKAKMTAMQEEMKTWAAQQGVDLSLLRQGFGKGRGGHPMR
jgi:type I site-specific restriction-modification system R (restriction) subunit